MGRKESNQTNKKQNEFEAIHKWYANATQILHVVKAYGNDTLNAMLTIGYL